MVKKTIFIPKDARRDDDGKCFSGPAGVSISDVFMLRMGFFCNVANVKSCVWKRKIKLFVDTLEMQQNQ